MGADWKNLRADAKRMEERIKELSEFGANREGGVSRVAFSDADVEGRKYIRSLMEKAGLKVRVDAAGNIIGHREGRNPNLPIILFGSFVDSGFRCIPMRPELQHLRRSSRHAEQNQCENRTKLPEGSDYALPCGQ